MNKFSPLMLTLFAIYILAAVVYMGFCWAESNARIAQIEKDFAPVTVPVMGASVEFAPVLVMAEQPAPGKHLSPVRTSPWYPKEAK